MISVDNYNVFYSVIIRQQCNASSCTGRMIYGGGITKPFKVKTGTKASARINKRKRSRLGLTLRRNEEKFAKHVPVSYTHLTLPTKRIV